MSQRVWLVTEGEKYYDAWLPHAIFSNEEAAHAYAAELISGNDSQRWQNVEVIEFEVDRIGHIEQLPRENQNT